MSQMVQRVAFVSGASRGIGKACAVLLARAGHRVILAARNLEKLDSVAAELRANGHEAFTVELDLASHESIKAAFAKAVQTAGPIEILVNNAGITKDALALRMKKEDWDAVIDTNLTGSFLAIQQVLHG